MSIAACGAVAVLTALSLLHLYWALGGTRLSRGVVPERDGAPLFHPGRGATLLVACALGAAALVVLGRWHRWNTPFGAAPFTLGCSTLAFVFGLRAIGDFRYVGFFKTERGSQFARLDSSIYAPLCLAIAAICTWLAIGS